MKCYKGFSLWEEIILPKFYSFRDPRIIKAFKPNEFFSLPLNRLNCVYGYEISALKKSHYICFSIINILLDKQNWV